MSRRAVPSTHLLARVRTWLGLNQAGLALDLADDRDDRSPGSPAGRLSKVASKISGLDYHLAGPSLPTEEKDTLTDEREEFVVHHKKPEKRNKQVTGVARLLSGVAAGQTDRPATLLTEVKAGIAAHRLTLAA